MPLPPLFMRSVIMAIKGAPKLRPFVGELMSRLISKQIWLNSAQVGCGAGGGKGRGSARKQLQLCSGGVWGRGREGAGKGMGRARKQLQLCTGGMWGRGQEGQGQGQETSAQPHPDQVMVGRDAG